MASTTGTLTISFIADYAGQHRVCYEVNSSGTTCVTTSCAGAGQTCSADILVTVDNESCSDVVFSGYVQPTCVDIDSMEKRVPFEFVFTPTPSCTRYVATCNSTSVDHIVLTGGGADYSSAPTVTISGGGGSGATAVAVLGSGAITTTTITFLSSGSGYNNGTYTNVDLLGGTGSGAKATITVSGGVCSAGVITAAGTGYTNGDTLVPDPSDLGGSTPLTNATFAVHSNMGSVVSITLTNAGSGYTAAPTVSLTESGDFTATAVAVLATCGSFLPSDCSGSSNNNVPDFYEVGESVAVCSNGPAPEIPSNWSVSASGNCVCDCQEATITITAGDAVVFYTECETGDYLGVPISFTDSPNYITVCLVTGSLKVIGGEATIIYSGSC